MRLRAATPRRRGGDRRRSTRPIVTGSAVSFETEPPDAAEMRGADRRRAAALYPWLVARGGRRARRLCLCRRLPRARPPIASPSRPASICADGAQRRGHRAARSTRPCCRLLEAQGFTQAIAAITLPNEASVRLHERLGFARAGTYRAGRLQARRMAGRRPVAARAGAARTPPEEPRPFASLLATDSAAARVGRADELDARAARESVHPRVLTTRSPVGSAAERRHRLVGSRSSTFRHRVEIVILRPSGAV